MKSNQAWPHLCRVLQLAVFSCSDGKQPEATSSEEAKKTSKHEQTRANTSKHEPTRANTSKHEQTRASTSKHEQTRANTSKHEQTRANTSKRKERGHDRRKRQNMAEKIDDDAAPPQQYKQTCLKP